MLTYAGSRKIAVFAQAVRDIQVQPFSVTLTTMSYEKRPEGVADETVLYSRRSDGTTCQRLTDRSGLTRYTLRTLTFPDGRKIVVGDAQQMKSTIYLDDVQRARYKDSLMPKANCLLNGQTAAAPGSLAASKRRYSVQRGQTSSMTSENRLSRTTWGSIPELGCFNASFEAETRNPDGSYTKTWEVQAGGLVDDEPPASEFEIPAHYTEVRPSVLLKVTRSRDVYAFLNAPVPNVTVSPESLKRIEQELAREDAAYDARRK